MQSSGFFPFYREQNPISFLVPMAQWTHSNSIPNLVVKRCCGEDTLGVAPRENSSVPGLSSKRGHYSASDPFLLVSPSPLGNITFRILLSFQLKLVVSQVVFAFGDCSRPLSVLLLYRLDPCDVLNRLMVCCVLLVSESF